MSLNSTWGSLAQIPSVYLRGRQRMSKKEEGGGADKAKVWQGIAFLLLLKNPRVLSETNTEQMKS